MTRAPAFKARPDWRNIMSDKETKDQEQTVCDCGKCHCPICAAAERSEECACCAHGCCCCGDETSDVDCGCEDDCGCSGDICNCQHGPCDSQTCTCACGCGGQGDAHVCPVCGMVVGRDGDCACVLHHKPPTRALVGLGLLGGVDLALKTWAIRRALHLDDKRWIVPLAVVNTVGLLPAYYLVTHPRK